MIVPNRLWPQPPCFAGSYAAPRSLPACRLQRTRMFTRVVPLAFVGSKHHHSWLLLTRPLSCVPALACRPAGAAGITIHHSWGQRGRVRCQPPSWFRPAPPYLGSIDPGRGPNPHRVPWYCSAAPPQRLHCAFAPCFAETAASPPTQHTYHALLRLPAWRKGTAVCALKHAPRAPPASPQPAHPCPGPLAHCDSPALPLRPPPSACKLFARVPPTGGSDAPARRP